MNDGASRCRTRNSMITKQNALTAWPNLLNHLHRSLYVIFSRTELSRWRDASTRWVSWLHEISFIKLSFEVKPKESRQSCGCKFAQLSTELRRHGWDSSVKGLYQRHKSDKPMLSAGVELTSL